MTRRRRTLATGVLALLVTLSACSTQLPTTPVPRQGLPVSVQTEQEVDLLLNPAQPGATPTEIVEGFLRANVGFAAADGGDVARSFLTTEVASAWIPTSGVLVHDGSLTVTETAPGQVTVEVPVIGRVDAQGRLTEQTARALSQTFELEEVDGQWRIEAFPEDFGLWLSRTELERAFQPTTLYYLNQQRGFFVPEVRWLTDGEGLPTALTRAQLSPLPEHLEGAVRTAATDTLRLATPAVPVDDETLVATVNLQGSTLVQDDTIAQQLQSQLAHALLGLPAVTGVEVQAAGQPLNLAGQTGPITADTSLPFTDLEREVDLALLRVGEELTAVDPTQFALRDLPPEATEDVELPRVGLSLVGLAVTADLEDFAALSIDGRSIWRWRSGDTYVNEGIGDELTAPAVDAQGAFWVGGVHRSSDTPRVWAIDLEDLDAVARPVEAQWLRDNERVDGVSISPDGSRALLVLQVGEDGPHRAVLSGIIRDGEGQPLGLTAPVPVAPSLSDVTSARWASIGDVVLVGRRGEEPLRPFSLRLGGWLQPLGELAALADVVAVPRGGDSAPDIIPRTDEGRLFTREGERGWGPARNGDELVVPGG